MNTNLIYEEESYAIRGALYEVYATLGPGFLEEVYQRALETELSLRGIEYLSKKPIRIIYKNSDCGIYAPDVICYGKIILELKAVDQLHDRHLAQLMNYMAATGFKLGMLVNFGAYPKIDIRRLVK